MRIVAISDLHADASTLGVSRFNEIEAAVSASVETAQRRSADLFIFAGDLADPESAGATFRAIELAQHTALKLARAGIPSVWLTGNHCVVDDGSGESVLSPLRALAKHEPKIMVADRPAVVPFGAIRLMLFPFTAIARAYDPAKWCTENWPVSRDVVTVSHLTVAGIVPGEETTEMPRGREVLFPTAETSKAKARIQGHYHRAQDFDPGDGGPPIHVIGSLCRLTFGEEHHRPSIFVLDV